jgi:hypothetical protein
MERSRNPTQFTATTQRFRGERKDCNSIWKLPRVRHPLCRLAKGTDGVPQLFCENSKLQNFILTFL